MNPNDIGKKLGIGLRVAGRMVHDHAQNQAQNRTQDPARNAADGSAQNRTTAGAVPASPFPGPSASAGPSTTQRGGNAAATTRSFTRAAGRGVGGFLRPFGRVGGILWLEVTGFFFGLFALYFSEEIWRTHVNYASGPMHQRFLIALALTAVFGYLSISAFWRARRR